MPRVTKQTMKPVRSKKTGSILDRLSSGWDMTETMSLLLYGVSGTGKTTIASTFPGPILWIIVSGGKKSGELRSVNTPAMRKKITPCVVQETADIRELIEEARNFSTAVVDHATGLQDLVLAKEILGLEEIPAQRSWGLASQQQYGQCTMMCKEILRAFLSLDCHRIVIAQERTFNSESNSDLIQPYISAALTPSLRLWLAPACDYIGNTFIRPKTMARRTKVGKRTVTREEVVKGKVEYCLRTAPHPIYAVKFRRPRSLGELPEAIVDPTYEKIELLVRGESLSPEG